jgi:hypothetical protein
VRDVQRRHFDPPGARRIQRRWQAHSFVRAAFLKTRP